MNAVVYIINYHLRHEWSIFKYRTSKHLSGSILAVSKPRIIETDASQIRSAFEICISSTPSTLSSEDNENEYKKNVEDPHNTKCLKSVPKVQKFLEYLIDGTYNELLDTIFIQKVDDNYSSAEQKYMQRLKYIMVDYHANCERPNYYTESNERTPYYAQAIPVFKYFSVVFKNISFVW